MPTTALQLEGHGAAAQSVRAAEVAASRACDARDALRRSVAGCRDPQLAARRRELLETVDDVGRALSAGCIPAAEGEALIAFLSRAAHMESF